MAVERWNALFCPAMFANNMLQGRGEGKGFPPGEGLLYTKHQGFGFHFYTHILYLSLSFSIFMCVRCEYKQGCGKDFYQGLKPAG